MSMVSETVSENNFEIMYPMCSIEDQVISNDALCGPASVFVIDAVLNS
jgi:hypothetical protein